MRTEIRKCVIIGLAVALSLAEAGFARQTTRRSQRVHMEQVQAASPDGKVKLTSLPNAERLTFTVALGETTVLDPSAIVMNVDGYDLSAGVVFDKVERYQISETYPWHGVHSTAANDCNGALISLKHDLSFIKYVLDIRVFNDGVALRHIVPGAENASRLPDEYTTFVISAGTTHRSSATTRKTMPQFALEERTVRQDDTLKIEMISGDGFVGRFTVVIQGTKPSRKEVL